jgi:phage-related protein
MSDSALFSKLFGMENTNAAMALVSGIDNVDIYSQAITGTNTAYEQAEIVMESYAEKQARIKARFDDLKISVFNTTGDMGIWTQVIASAMIPLTELMPLFAGVSAAIGFCRKNWSKFVKSVKTDVTSVNTKLFSLTPSIISVGVGFKAMSIMAKSACRSIGIAIMSIPIVGWIAAAIAVIIGVITLLWKKSEGFRRLVMGVWESIKAIFHNVWVVIKAVFDIIWNNILKPYFNLWKSIFVGIWNVVKWCVEKIIEGVKWLWNGVVGIATAIGDFFVGIWTWVTDTVSNAFDWIVNKLGVVGKWIKEKLVDPIKNAFSNVWSVIKDVFNKILNGLGKLFSPIKELWNKIFPKDKFKDVSAAYNIGAEKGSKSFRKDKDKDKDKDDSPDDDVSFLGGGDGNGKLTPASSGGLGGNLSGGNLGSNAGTSAGKAQQINITLGKMVDTINFNGGLRENAKDVENQLTEIMARILGMAETAV